MRRKRENKTNKTKERGEKETIVIIIYYNSIL